LKDFVKHFLLGVVTGAILLTLAAALYLRLGFTEVRADLPPSMWETKLMYSAVHASVAREAPEMPNPVSPTDENLIAGGKIFLGGCSGCHGDPRKSDDDGASLFPPIPQFHKVGTEYSEAQIFWIAKHGIRRTGMFVNGRWYKDNDLWAAAAFIKRIKDLPPSVRNALEEKPVPPAQ
jgi:mono/diheme cytochrome c family protein